MRADVKLKFSSLPRIRLPNPFSFAAPFCFIFRMDAALPPLTAGPSPKQGGYGLASSTLYLVAMPLRRPSALLFSLLPLASIMVGATSVQAQLLAPVQRLPDLQHRPGA